jgi:hypothetical protein
MSTMYKQEEVKEHDVIPVAYENGSNTRREKRLLSGKFDARNRRKRQKLVNEFTKNQNIELKAIVRRQAEELKESKQQAYDELKEMRSRNADLEFGLRQACVDNLTLLKANVQNKQEREYILRLLTITLVLFIGMKNEMTQQR